MSYTAEDKLPKDFFQEIIEEKAEMIRKYLKDAGNPLVFTTHIGPNMATFKFYSPKDEENSFKTALYILKSGGPERTAILFMGPIEMLKVK